MKRYRVGVVGCGRIGSLLEDDPLRGKPCTHAGAFNALPSARIVAGCDVDPDRLKRFGDRWSVDRLYGDYREMLDKENLDVVCIAAWTRLHAKIASDAARSGVRGIFCEKPIANTLAEARALVRLCERKKVLLSINHERRWDGYYQKARELIRRGTLGEIRSIVGNALSWKPGKLSVAKHGGGAWFHDGTHLADILLYFGGPVDWVCAHEVRSHGKKNIEDTAAAMLRFRNGAVGFIEGGGARKYFNFELDVQGSEGRLLIGNGGQRLFLCRKSRRFTGFSELEPVQFPAPRKYESPFVAGARDMVRSLRVGKPGLSSGQDGLKALEVVMAVYKSASLKGQRVKINARL